MPVYYPEINFTHFTYNTTDDCGGPLTAYTATQSQCFNTIDNCCKSIATKNNVVLNNCLNNSMYHCGVVTLSPTIENIVSSFEWTLIILGGITLVCIVFLLIRFIIRCLFCNVRGYRELN
jgi:hypothetical protein